MRGEAVTELLFFLGGPGGSHFRPIGICGALYPHMFLPLQHFKCHKQGPDGVGLLIGTIWRKRFAGCRVAPVRKDTNDLCCFLCFHG